MSIRKILLNDDQCLAIAAALREYKVINPLAFTTENGDEDIDIIFLEKMFTEITTEPENRNMEHGFCL